MWQEILNNFLKAKKLEGCSAKTLTYYNFNLFKLLSTIGKEVNDVTAEDVREYLLNYKEMRKVANSTLDNMRRVFSSFFGWLTKQRIIDYDPMIGVNRIKVEKRIKHAFTQEELNKMREGAPSLRDYAIIELLYSSGVRVGELVQINKQDICWSNRSIIVFGKGAKEREVYFNLAAKEALETYLDSRTDDNEALFVSLIRPYERISISACERMLHKFGTRLGIAAHPHKFRRTCATTLLNRGMAIQEVAQILGHAKVETTMIYCDTEQQKIARDYRRCMDQDYQEK